jgi:hypothetical protein
VIPHTPLEHEGVPPAELHTVEQVPQCVASVLRLTSQPLDALPSQLENPVLQVIEHTPAAHDGVPLVELHAVTQLPQWTGSVLMSVSQPFDTLPSQFA